MIQEEAPLAINDPYYSMRRIHGMPGTFCNGEMIIELPELVAPDEMPLMDPDKIPHYDAKGAEPGCSDCERYAQRAIPEGTVIALLDGPLGGSITALQVDMEDGDLLYPPQGAYQLAWSDGGASATAKYVPGTTDED